jgi:hypothetical protein
MPPGKHRPILPAVVASMSGGSEHHRRSGRRDADPVTTAVVTATETPAMLVTTARWQRTPTSGQIESAGTRFAFRQAKPELERRSPLLSLLRAAEALFGRRAPAKPRPPAFRLRSNLSSSWR